MSEETMVVVGGGKAEEEEGAEAKEREVDGKKKREGIRVGGLGLSV